ncbi:hemerythrin domain-containing protein [Schinkia sp. CFF1]
MASNIEAQESKPLVELCAGLTRLKEEHIPLLQKIDNLLLLSEQIEKEGDSLQKFAELKSQVEAFKGEIVIHSQHEENALFLLMAKHIDPSTGPIAVNTGEHKEARSLLDSFLEKAGNEKLTSTEIKESLEIIMNAANLLKNHFAKEENLLFPKAENMLTADEKSELLTRIQEIK